MRQGAQGWCTGMTQRDGTGREVEGGFRTGNTCIPVVDLCQCMSKPIQYCKVKNKREGRSKGEKERYKHLNAEFQRIAGRDKKAFLSDQCKEIEEENRIGKTRDLFRKILDTKAIFHAKMGTVKERNDADLTEAEDIKKRWQVYTEELYKKTFHNPDNHDGVITHLEPDILECEVGLRKHHYEQS